MRFGRFLAYRQRQVKVKGARVMTSRVRIVKKNETREPEPAAVISKGGDELSDREIVAVVKSWIEEFKLRSRTGSRIRLAR
jgi:hypothetical protein